MATTDDSDSRWIVDANILVFAANPSSPLHAAAPYHVSSPCFDRLRPHVGQPKVLPRFVSVTR
jgi:hypothetical protein